MSDDFIRNRRGGLFPARSRFQTPSCGTRWVDVRRRDCLRCARARTAPHSDDVDFANFLVDVTRTHCGRSRVFRPGGARCPSRMALCALRPRPAPTLHAVWGQGCGQHSRPRHAPPARPAQEPPLTRKSGSSSSASDPNQCLQLTVNIAALAESNCGQRPLSAQAQWQIPPTARWFLKLDPNRSIRFSTVGPRLITNSDIP
jgi:hypothetical protein